MTFAVLVKAEREPNSWHLQGLSAAIALLAMICGCRICVADTIASRLPEENSAADKYRITSEERAACGPDALTFCSFTYPDEDKLLVCMRQNHASLSKGCRVVFDEGVRRRHVN